MTSRQLVALAESLGVESEDLDLAVHDLAQEIELRTLNSLDGADDQEDHIAAQEAFAAGVNNGGLAAQIGFLLEHLPAEEVESLIRATREGE